MDDDALCLIVRKEPALSLSVRAEWYNKNKKEKYIPNQLGRIRENIAKEVNNPD